MAEDNSDLLRRILLVGYDDLKLRLTRRFGSAELAAEALQDTWLRLEGLAPSVPVQRPWPYVLRIATNIALKRLIRERETVTLGDARAALDLPDGAPDAERTVEARSELARLREAVQELKPRRREILLAARLDGIPLQELAVRHGISQRMVERELRAAVLHCAQRLDRNVVQRFGPRPQNGSRDETP